MLTLGHMIVLQLNFVGWMQTSILMSVIMMKILSRLVVLAMSVEILMLISPNWRASE